LQYCKSRTSLNLYALSSLQQGRKSYIPDSLMHQLAGFGQPPQMSSGMHLHMTFESQTCGRGG